jgi:hypothetical protein
MDGALYDSDMVRGKCFRVIITNFARNLTEENAIHKYRRQGIISQPVRRGGSRRRVRTAQTGRQIREVGK